MQQFISLHAARFLPERAAPHSAVNTQHYQLKAFSNPIAVKCYDGTDKEKGGSQEEARQLVRKGELVEVPSFSMNVTLLTWLSSQSRRE